MKTLTVIVHERSHESDPPPIEVYCVHGGGNVTSLEKELSDEFEKAFRHVVERQQASKQWIYGADPQGN